MNVLSRNLSGAELIITTFEYATILATAADLGFSSLTLC